LTGLLLLPSLSDFVVMVLLVLTKIAHIRFLVLLSLLVVTRTVQKLNYGVPSLITLSQSQLIQGISLMTDSIYLANYFSIMKYEGLAEKFDNFLYYYSIVDKISSF
jgi:hypothetical protein